MSEKTTLGNARGLNSIADPRKFKGSSGRAKPTERPADPEPPRLERERPPPAPPEPADTENQRPNQRQNENENRRQNHEPAPSPKSVKATQPAPHRAVQPGVQRKRRELSVPHQVADALEATGINPADVVMSGYRRHSDAVYAGAGGRMAAKGRTRLRLSISDAEFEQITRLGLARGWNRSETVSVILAMELASRAEALRAATPASS